MTDMRKFKSERDIQAGLIACLAIKNFQEITINDICERGLVGRSTFYHHYADKYALLEAMVNQRAEVFDHLLAVRLVNPSADELLLQLYDALVGDAPAIIRLMPIHENNGDLSRRYLDSLIGLADQLLPQDSLTIPRSFALELYSSSALTAIRWSLINGDAQHISKFMNQLVRDVLNKEV